MNEKHDLINKNTNHSIVSLVKLLRRAINVEFYLQHFLFVVAAKDSELQLGRVQR